MCALWLPSRHQGLAYSATDDVVRGRGSRGASLQSLPLWSRLAPDREPLGRDNAGSMYIRIRAHSRQNGELGRIWPRGGFDGGIPSSGQSACGRNGAPANPSGGRQIGASNADRQAISDPTIGSYQVSLIMT